MKPERRVKLAWGLLALCVVGWPVSALFPSAVIQQFILGLSWLALIIGALDIVATTDVRAKQHKDES